MIEIFRKIYGKCRKVKGLGFCQRIIDLSLSSFQYQVMFTVSVLFERNINK